MAPLKKLKSRKLKMLKLKVIEKSSILVHGVKNDKNELVRSISIPKNYKKFIIESDSKIEEILNERIAKSETHENAQANVSIKLANRAEFYNTTTPFSEEELENNYTSDNFIVNINDFHSDENNSDFIRVINVVFGNKEIKVGANVPDKSDADLL